MKRVNLMLLSIDLLSDVWSFYSGHRFFSAPYPAGSPKVPSSLAGAGHFIYGLI